VKKVYVNAQWQGGADRSTYDGAEELRKYLPGQDYVILPVSTEEAEMAVMPYRPRYICPDYELLFQKGCKFLELGPPKDLLEALNVLEIFYCHVPSITSFPVYLGDLDKLLEPFVVKEDRAFAKKLLGLFLRNIDRVQTDSFVHADIGPEDSVTGRLLLELTEEMQLAVPNLTLKYDPEKTSDDFALACIHCMLKTAKPSFANHRMFVSEWGERYAIASCYNGLSIAGGGFTLPRLRLYECALDAKSVEDFLERELPRHIDLQLEYMDKRVKFIVEQSSFFKTNFLVTEGFVKQENFTGMFGVVGLAECCNYLLGIADKKHGFGMNQEATELGIRIMDAIDARVKAHEAPYCDAYGHRYRLHAQVGIDTDGIHSIGRHLCDRIFENIFSAHRKKARNRKPARQPACGRRHCAL